MKEFFDWLSVTPLALIIFMIAFGIVVLSIIMIYVIAFIQGRSVSFWPPKIGEKPAKPMHQTSAVAWERSKGKSENPIVQRGSMLRTVTGQVIQIDSDFYGGANATLYRARNALGENVIVKVFWRGLMPGSSAWELFSQEQRMAEMLTHRNIVKILDRGLQGGYPFTVLEYFAGGTLRDWLRTHDRIPGQDLLSIASQVADAIDFAHSCGVVHRDIKPGNILFQSGPHDRVALGDFGIARIFSLVERDTTAQGGEFIGSPGYIAPEVLSRNDVSTASDIYSFGVVLYEMIAGKIPFDEYDTVYSIMNIKSVQDAPDIRLYRKGIPEVVALRLEQTLSRNPTRRPGSARAVISGIEHPLGRL
jgi:serine/threonine-protein kinase